MRVLTVGCESEKRVGDDNYGSERSQVSLSAALEPGDDPQDCLDVLLTMARTRIEADLRQSVTLAVRRKMSPAPRLCNECNLPLADDESGYLHPGCDEVRIERRKRERAEEGAIWEAERRKRELAAVGADAEGDGDDDDGPPF